MSWGSWGDGPVRPASPSVLDEVLRVSRGARRPGRSLRVMNVSPDVAARLMLVSEQLSKSDGLAPALPLWGVPVVLDPKLPPGTVQWTYHDGETVRPHLAHHDAQEAPTMTTTTTTPATRPRLFTGWRLLVFLGAVLALLLAVGVAVLRPAPADAAVGAYPYIRHDGRCTIDVGTTSPDRARANTLANGQQVKPGYRVGKVAAPKGCILTVRSLAGTQTVTTKGILTWVTLPRKTEGFVEVTSRR